MIFILHYFLSNFGLSAILILITLYLQTYSDASLSEIGTLLMVLPFLSTFTKPLVCAMADRQQAHKTYLLACIFFMVLGYGSLTIAPFFPDFVQNHGRIVWYINVVGIVVGNTAFGINWSMGDALAVNAARRNNVPWGSYRAWATAAWGIGGLLIGQVNETPYLPKYVPAMFIYCIAMSLEFICVAFWPAKEFSMSYDEKAPLEPAKNNSDKNGKSQVNQEHEIQDSEANWPSNRSLTGTLSGSARMNPRLVGAVANVFMEDLGSTIKSSLRLGQRPKRAALADILAEHNLAGNNPTGVSEGAAPESNGVLRGSSLALNATLRDKTPEVPASMSRPSTLGKAAMIRAHQALSRLDSLSAASGHAIAYEVVGDLDNSNSKNNTMNGKQKQQVMMMSSLASNASLSRAAAARALGFGSSTIKESPVATKLAEAPVETKSEASEDLQLVLLKLIVKRDANIIKWVILFTIFGILLAVHINYFFIHVEQICHATGYDFSQVIGAYLAAQSVSEVLSFVVIVPYFIPKIGRPGALIACALAYAIRYLYYGTYLEHFSPYLAIATETSHGIAYGIIYSLITDIAVDCVNHVDVYLPELIERRVVEPSIDTSLLKLPLRATMQGIFSGAFDGLGNGIGALVAGVWLDYYSFPSLWLACFGLSAVMIVYPLVELLVRRSR